MLSTQWNNSISACIDLGHLPDKDSPEYCLDCNLKIADNPIESLKAERNKKDKLDKKATITKGTSTVKVTPPPEPRVYKPHTDFVDFLPGGPPQDVRPKDPVGAGKSVSGGYSIDDYMGWY